MPDGGYNPMRYRCDISGCYNIIKRPKIEIFAECFPRKIGMSDIDATVELNGYFLFLEFKSHQGDLPTGQRIYFERLTRLSWKIAVIVLCADAETMDITHMQHIYEGVIGPWEPTSLEAVKAELIQWSDWTVGKVRMLAV